MRTLGWAYLRVLPMPGLSWPWIWHEAAALPSWAYCLTLQDCSVLTYSQEQGTGNHELRCRNTEQLTPPIRFSRHLVPDALYNPEKGKDTNNQKSASDCFWWGRRETQAGRSSGGLLWDSQSSISYPGHWDDILLFFNQDVCSTHSFICTGKNDSTCTNT